MYTQNKQEKELTIGPHDVLCGRTKDSFNNIGNRRFRVIVSTKLRKYVDVTSTRKEKGQIIESLIQSTQECGGRFLQVRNGSLTELSYKQAYEKVGHAIRDMASAREVGDNTWMSESRDNDDKKIPSREIFTTTEPTNDDMTSDKFENFNNFIDLNTSTNLSHVGSYTSIQRTTSTNSIEYNSTTEHYHSKDMSTTQLDSSSKEIIGESIVRADFSADSVFGDNMTESDWASYLQEMSPEKNENHVRDVMPPAPSGWDIHQLTVGRSHFDPSIFSSTTSNNETINSEGLQFHPSIFANEFDYGEVSRLPSRKESEESETNAWQTYQANQP
jgi:hypothetical protein